MKYKYIFWNGWGLRKKKKKKKIKQVECEWTTHSVSTSGILDKENGVRGEGEGDKNGHLFEILFGWSFVQQIDHVKGSDWVSAKVQKEKSPLFPFKIERKKNCWWPKEGHLCKVKGVSHLAETTSNWVGWDFWWVHLLACLILFRRRRSSLNDGDVSFLLAFRWGT